MTASGLKRKQKPSFSLSPVPWLSYVSVEDLKGSDSENEKGDALAKLGGLEAGLGKGRDPGGLKGSVEKEHGT